MNPFRQNDPPVVNKTEIELARIREHEETKRQQTAAREKTKQTARGADGYWIVRGMAIIAAALITLIVSIAYYNVQSDRVHAEHPETGCVETAEIITSAASQRSCANGGWFESKPTDQVGAMLIRCHCGPKPVASNGPSTTSVVVGRGTMNEPVDKAHFYEVIVKVVVCSDGLARAAQDVERWLGTKPMNPGFEPRSVRVLGAKDIDDQIMGGKASEP